MYDVRVGYTEGMLGKELICTVHNDGEHDVKDKLTKASKHHYR